MFDLVAEVAAHERHRRAGIEIGGAEHLPQVPLAVRLVDQRFLVELLGAIGEVTTEDDEVRPEVTNQVGRQIGREGTTSSLARQQREDHIVLGQLLGDLLREVLDLRDRNLFRLVSRQVLADLQVVQTDSPLEGGSEEQVDERLGQVLPLPRFVARHPQHPVAHVVIHADHIRVLVMDVVVRVLPVGRSAHHVPLPRRGVHLRVVHPIPLAVHDIVAEFHVLDDLGDRKHGRSAEPQQPVAASQQCQPTADLQESLCGDGAPQILGVALAAVGFDLASQCIELVAEGLDVGFGQMRIRVDVIDCHRAL